MLKISLPGREKSLELHKLVLDLNGTLTTDGVIVDGVQKRIELLKNELPIYLLTSDTLGTGTIIADELGIELFRVSAKHGRVDKQDYINTINADQIAVIGNGYNDVSMFEAAALSIAIIGREGCCGELLNKADIVVNNVLDALDLFITPLRIKATLRG